MESVATYTFESCIISPGKGEHKGKWFAQCHPAFNRDLKPEGPFKTFDEAKDHILLRLNVQFERFRQKVDGRI